MKYSLHVIWSPEDETFLATVPELPGCLADGKSHEEAVANLLVVAQEWVETAKEEGREVPAPITLDVMLQMEARARTQAQEQLQKAINSLLETIAAKQQPAVAAWRTGAYSSFELASGKPKR
jgi:predicted RNase H-like HicB family nuclease